MINLQKFEVSFSRNVKRDVQDSLVSHLGVNQVARHEKYMGLPPLVGRNCGHCFNFIKERLWKHFQSWKGKLLSSMGRKIMVKVIAQAIPLYAMNYFILPKYFCDDLNSLVAHFWWSSSDEGRRIHWLAWDKLCLPKSETRAFVLGISTPSISGYWPNRLGSSKPTLVLWWPRSFVPNTTIPFPFPKQQ